MIGETAWLSLPVVLEVNGVVGLSMKSIDMYIGHDSRVGVCFAKRSRIQRIGHWLLLTIRSGFIFARSPLDGGSVTI